jgi:hypothetical protein
MCEVCELVDSLEVETLTEANLTICFEPRGIIEGVKARWAE